MEMEAASAAPRAADRNCRLISIVGVTTVRDERTASPAWCGIEGMSPADSIDAATSIGMARSCAPGGGRSARNRCPGRESILGLFDQTCLRGFNFLPIEADLFLRRKPVANMLLDVVDQYLIKGIHVYCRYEDQLRRVDIDIRHARAGWRHRARGVWANLHMDTDCSHYYSRPRRRSGRRSVELYPGRSASMRFALGAARLEEAHLANHSSREP